MTKEFKKDIRGAYELYIDKKATGFSFFIPNGYKIDDYANKIEYIQPKGAYLSAKACFRIISSPSQFEKAYMDSNTSLTFKDGLVINVSKNIYLSTNDNVVLEAKGSTKTLSFDDFVLSRNQGTHFCFSGEISDSNRKSKNQSEKLFDARNNGEGLINLRDDVEKFELMRTTILKLYPTDPISGDINSIDFDSRNVLCKYSRVHFGDAQSHIVLSSDNIDIESSSFEIRNGKTIIAQTDKDFSILNVKEAQVIGGLTRPFNNKPSPSKKSDKMIHWLVTDSPNLLFDKNTSVSILYNNRILSNGDIVFSGKNNNALSNASLDFGDKGAELSKNEIVNTTISFSNGHKKNKSSSYLLKDNTLVDSNIKGLSTSKLQKWNVKNLKATDIASESNAALLSDGAKLEAQNLVLEKGSSLSLTTNNSEECQLSLSNSVIKGKNMLQSSGEMNIKNSILENTNFINKNEKEQKLIVSESSLKGISSVRNIKEISRSSICDSTLTAKGEPKTICDDFLDQITNLDELLKQREMTPHRQDFNSSLEIL